MKIKDIPIIEILELQNIWTENNNKGIFGENPFVYEILGNKYGSEKLVFKKMEKLADDGYLEYGVSLRTAWLTEKGKRFLTPKVADKSKEE